MRRPPTGVFLALVFITQTDGGAAAYLKSSESHTAVDCGCFSFQLFGPTRAGRGCDSALSSWGRGIRAYTRRLEASCGFCQRACIRHRCRVLWARGEKGLCDWAESSLQAYMLPQRRFYRVGLGSVGKWGTTGSLYDAWYEVPSDVEHRAHWA
jgi:hypothetical protein